MLASEIVQLNVNASAAKAVEISLLSYPLPSKRYAPIKWCMYMMIRYEYMLYIICTNICTYIPSVSVCIISVCVCRCSRATCARSLSPYPIPKKFGRILADKISKWMWKQCDALKKKLKKEEFCAPSHYISLWYFSHFLLFSFTFNSTCTQ